MRRLLFLTVLSMLVSSCGVSSLYYWGGNRNGTSRYEHFAYKSYDKQTPESICQLICVYDDMVRNPSGTRRVPPPGICAEYGYLLLQPDTAEIFQKNATSSQRRIFSRYDYAALFHELGMEMFEKEMELYPESVQFIKPLFEKISKR